MNFNIIQNNTYKLSFYKEDGSPEIPNGSYLFYYMVGTADEGIEIRCGYKSFIKREPGTVIGDYRTGVLMNNANQPARDGAGNADFWGLISNGSYIFKPSSVLFPIEYIEETVPTETLYSVISTIPLSVQLQNTAGYYISITDVDSSYYGYHETYPTLVPDLSGTNDPSFGFSNVWKSFPSTWFSVPTVNYKFAGGTTHCCLLFLAPKSVTKDEALTADKLIKSISTANLDSFDLLYSK